MKGKLIFLFLLAFSTHFFGQNHLERGEKLLQENKPDQALVFLQAGLESQGPSQKLYHYISLSHQALDQKAQALEAIEKALALQGELSYLLEYNRGNILFQMGDYPGAEQSFTRSLSQAPGLHANVLNRANSRLNMGDYSGSLADYVLFQDLEPSNPQKAQIDEVIALLRAQLASEEERARLAEAERLAQIAREKAEEERKAAQAEAARLEAERLAALEAERAAEEQRRREELLARIRGSLEGAGEDSQSLREGAQEIEDFEDEFTLDG